MTKQGIVMVWQIHAHAHPRLHLCDKILVCIRNLCLSVLPYRTLQTATFISPYIEIDELYEWSTIPASQKGSGVAREDFKMERHH